MRKVSSDDMLNDRRVSFTTDLSGVIQAVEPENSLLYGWPVDSWKGGRIADVSGRPYRFLRARSSCCFAAALLAGARTTWQECGGCS